MKAHFVERFTKPGDMISLYRNGKFIDFCRGPHVPSTGRVKAFKIMSLSGHTGSVTKRTRSCSGFMGRRSSRKKDMDDYFERLEEAKRGTTAGWAKSLNFFPWSEVVGSGLPFGFQKARPFGGSWRSNSGARARGGYQHVFTPHLAKVELLYQFRA